MAAKKRSARGGKDKGQDEHHRHAGLGRMRRAGRKPRARHGGWEQHADDDSYLERVGSDERPSHSGEALLVKFNRLARDANSGSGESGEICGSEAIGLLVRDASGTELPCQVRRVLKKMLAGVKTPLVVGDRVRFERQPDGDGVVTALEERRNQLARADSHNKALIHVFAANVDRVVIVASMAMPEIKTGLIDRYLVIAHANGIPPMIVLNKADLADPDEVAALYRGLGYPVFVTVAAGDAKTERGIVELRDELRGRSAVFAGQSGIGKSSLIKALYPELELRIGEVSEIQQKGRHTTTASRSYLLPDGARLIDTPGIREFGISGLDPLDIALLYPDIAARHQDCRFHNCTHIHEPDCAVQAAVEAGQLDVRRYLSYISIISEDLGA